jgi:UDP-N-acetylmuramoylalanine--D-glutamate ligase
MATYLQQLMHLVGSRVLVLGYGPNHRSIVSALIRAGVEVVVRDKNSALAAIVETTGAQFECKADILDSIPNTYTAVLRAPSIASTHQQLEKYRAGGGLVTSQTQLFLSLCPARTIGITGTKGKSTTATLTAKALEATYGAGKVYLGGNIGTDPFAFLDDVKPEDIVVLELSSYQLEECTAPVSIAVIVQTTEDHIEHHGGIQQYWDAKAQLLRGQNADGVAIIYADALSSPFFLKEARGEVLAVSPDTATAAVHCEYEQGEEFAVITYRSQKIKAPLTPRALLGKHHRENMLAALTVCAVCGVDCMEAARVMRAFAGLPHRLEPVHQAEGVEAINDSIATNPQASLASMAVFAGKRIHLIAGGNPKGASVTEWAHIVDDACVSVGFLPGPLEAEVTPLLTKCQVVPSNSHADPLECMYALLLALPYQQGDIILLAPAAASVTPYTGYDHRGAIFVEAIKQFAAQQGGKA